MTYRDILYEQDDQTVTITLNRPEKLNAYTVQMGRELESAFERVDRDDGVRVVIVTGAGRGFCAGADMSAGAGSFDLTAQPDASIPANPHGDGFVQAIYNCSKPSIVAFNGPAFGVGVTLTLPMDIRIATTGTQFGLVFARRGLVPEAASAWFLPRIVGLSQSLAWCLTGRTVRLPRGAQSGLAR